MNRLNKNIAILVIATIVFTIVFLALIKPKMKFPVKGPITSKYGMRKHPVTGEYKLHNGVDLGVPTGTEVKPNLPGSVVAVWWSDSGGNQMKLEFKNGYRMSFAHLSKVLKKEGEKFKSNETVALTGNTGRSTGPHLHLTMRDPQNELIDPQKILS